MYDSAELQEQKKALLMLSTGGEVWQSLALVSFRRDLLLHTDNSVNQMSDYLPDLLAHLSSQPIAGKCVTAMLSTNKEPQETKITVGD